MPLPSLSSVAIACARLWLGCIVALLAGLRLSAQDADRSQHIFVIDHSYSMNSDVKTPFGVQSRWNFVLEKLEEWLDTLPTDGSAEVSILLFNDDVPGKPPNGGKGDPYLLELGRWTEKDRAKTMAFVKRIGEPVDGERTALWNALGWAWRKIDAEGKRYSSSWVYLFTDGEDTKSAKRGNDPFTFDTGKPGSEPGASREPVIQKWRTLVAEHPNSYLIEQPLGDMKAPLPPEAEDPKNKHIYTSRPELKDQLRIEIAPAKPEYPSVTEPQKVELSVRLAGTGKKRLPKDASFRLDFQSEDPDVQLKVEPEILPLQEGRQLVTITVKSGKVRDGVKGQLKLGFPELDKTDILGPKEVSLQFAAVAKVSAEIQVEGQKWQVGRPLQLTAKHTGESVEWDFGDGTKATGDTQSHVWSAAGTFEVSLVAKAANRDPAERKIRIEVVPAALSTQQQPDQGVIAGKPVLFTAKVENAKASRFEWLVDGASRNARDGDGNELECRFEVAGAHEVFVRAYTDICVMERKVVVQVGEGLSLRIEDFPSTLDAGLDAKFAAVLKGPSKKKRLKWTILDPASGAPVDGSAGGASPVNAETSVWAPKVPQGAPAEVIVRVQAELEDEEQRIFGDVVDEVRVKVRPPGLYTRKERPADASSLVVGESTTFQAAWSGTGAVAVEDIRWEVLRDGRPLLEAKVVKSSKADGLASSQFAVNLPTSGEVLGKQIAVTATPFVNGALDPTHAASWLLSARLPVVDYRVATNALSFGGMDYGSPLQVGLEPQLFVQSVVWDWGDNKTQSAKPGDVLQHSYQLGDAGSKRVVARIQRIDGTMETAQLLFELRVPSFEIQNPGAVRIQRNGTLRIGPATLAKYVKQVYWDFGAGFLPPESDLETTHMWSDRAGPQPVRAKIKLEDGSERVLPELSVNVVASKTIDHDIQVVGGETHGAVELKANIREESDFLSVETDVLRDDQLIKTLSGVVSSFSVVEGEFGTYTYRFRARRAPSPENAETEVVLGEIRRTYRLRRYLLAFSVLAGGGLLLWLLVWCGVLYQYPRKWKLKLTTESPLVSESLSSLDSRGFALERPAKKGVKRPHWAPFQLHKQLTFKTSELVREWFTDEEREGGLKWLESDDNKLRIDPRRHPRLDSPGEGWSGPETHPTQRDVEIYSRPASRSQPGSATLYAWLEAKAHGASANILAAVLLLAGIAAWIWFAMTHCHLFR